MNAIRFQSLLSTLTAAVLLASAATAGAVQNPLDANAFPGQPENIVTAAVGPAYQDSSNPLNPAFQCTSKGDWEGTAAVNSTPYRNVSNPLYPRYQR